MTRHGSSSSGGASSGGGTTISMKDIKFAPESESVKVGQKVTWTNDDQVDHNVRADSGALFASANFGSGGSYSFTKGTLTVTG